MPPDFAAFIATLRAAGVTRFEIDIASSAAPAAPAEFMSPAEVAAILDPPPEPKGAGICVAPGCNAPNGHRFAPEYCRDHALAAAGVD
jgi:hypothetical protein